MREKEYIIFDGGYVGGGGEVKQKLTVNIGPSKCQILFQAFYTY